MPVILEDIDLTQVTTTKTKTISPKFFSSKLTGNGKKLGLLNENLRPINNLTNPVFGIPADIEVKATHTAHDVEATAIPLAPLMRCVLDGPNYLTTLPVPEIGVFDVKTGSTNNGFDILFNITPQGAMLFEDGSGDTMSRSFVVQYRMELFAVSQTALAAHAQAQSHGTGQALRVNTVTTTHLIPSRVTTPAGVVRLGWSTSPVHDAVAFINDSLEALAPLLGANLSLHNDDDLLVWFNDYSVHDAIVEQAAVWSSEAMAEVINPVLREVASIAGAPELNIVAKQLRYLENYNVSLDAYRSISQTIASVFAATTATTLTKQNLNLLMNHTLDELAQLKPQLATPAVPAAGQVSLPAHLSNQQLAAITTHEPLVMTQAGAGTGKSTTILQRIDYLTQCGVAPSDITVLSFTNAAADNISEKNPDVGSMTIAAMINDIYRLNHPTHELSSLDTIINSIDIFFAGDNVAEEFRQRLVALAQNKNGAYTSLNTFVEANIDAVLGLLDKIKQTSLELEIIVCYQQIDTMLEPPNVACRHLIIDEVQDNSIFEFVYVLKYVSKHKQSLFIVGDASQTLYEFRSANPRALNTLEGSGVFATYKLSTNYRSNQEVLDFANMILGSLETNQYANINLQANDLALPTADSFKSKITLDYRRLEKTSRFINEELGLILANTICPEYVDACLDRGEQVAFLAYSRREVAIFEEVLARRYPTKQIANMVSEKVYATDIFSKFIKLFWSDILQVQPANASFAMVQAVKNNLHKLTKNGAKVEKPVMAMMSKWWTENSIAINGWVQMTQAGIMTHRQFFDDLRDNLLSFEIRHNAVRQSLMNQKNRERKQANTAIKADLVISTIHGAKGLEFDNVVVVHKESSNMSQENQRLFYVAFTRAVTSEYVLSYGTLANPPIVSGYKQIVDLLEKRDLRTAQRNAAMAAGLDPDLLETLSEEDAAAALASVGLGPDGLDPASDQPSQSAD